MIAIKPYAKIIDTNIGVDVLKKIELVGRTCYKSTENIKEGSEEKFVSNLIKRGHEAMLEHASFCFMTDGVGFLEMIDIDKYLQRKHPQYISFLRYTNDTFKFISGNVRAWRSFFKICYKENKCIPISFEEFILDNPILFPEFQEGKFMKFLNFGVMRPAYIEDLSTKNEILTHRDVTVRFVVDRGVSHEVVRHRPASFAQESTRYCNYSKDKFGNQLTFITPEFFQYGSKEWILWETAMEECENTYLTMMKLGIPPEQARTVLPNSLKTEVIMTANCAEWKHFFELRACNKTGKAHPQMLEVSRPLLDDFKKSIKYAFDGVDYAD